MRRADYVVLAEACASVDNEQLRTLMVATLVRHVGNAYPNFNADKFTGHVADLRSKRRI